MSTDITNTVLWAGARFERYAGGRVPEGDEESLVPLQIQAAAWQGRNFGAPTAEKLALGVCEEAGELAHAVLKASQGIRGMADRDRAREAIADALGDIAVYSMQLATLYRLDYETVVRGVADQVLERDWFQDPEAGGQ